MIEILYIYLCKNKKNDKTIKEMGCSKDKYLVMEI